MASAATSRIKRPCPADGFSSHQSHQTALTSRWLQQQPVASNGPDQQMASAATSRIKRPSLPATTRVKTETYLKKNRENFASSKSFRYFAKYKNNRLWQKKQRSRKRSGSLP
jgi:hypothetical protein